MDNTLANALAEQWRDALSGYVIHHVLPHKLKAQALGLITADHLDRYLMMDTQVSAAVSTSYLAEALACTQTYINAIFNNIEPGYDNTPAPELLTFWRQGMANYSLWAAYQMLEDYPENYIRADLRLDRTQLFQALGNDLGQARITQATVQQALLKYLNQYEYQNSIRVQSGYVDYRGGHLDQDHFPGYAFANADYYLLGKDTASPARYYWRKVKVRLDQASTYIQPDAWSEWQAIAMPSTHTLVQACLVLFCGRLQLAWLHHDTPVDVNDEATQRYTLKLDMMYLGLDGQWSSPENLWQEVGHVDAGQVPDLAAYCLLTVAVAGARGSDDQLLVAVGVRNADEPLKFLERYSLQRDVLKRQALGEDAFDLEMREWLLGYFYPPVGDEPPTLGLQRRVSSTDWALESVVPAPDNDRYLVLDALYERHAQASGRLHLRASLLSRVSAEKVVSLHLSQAGPVGALGLVYVEVYSDGRGGLEWRCRILREYSFTKVTLKHPAMEPVDLSPSDFTQRRPGYYEASAPLDLTQLNDMLVACSPDEVRAGAGFTFTVDDEREEQLFNASNFISKRFETVQWSDVELKAGGVSLWEGTFTLNGAATTGWVSHAWPTSQGNTLQVTLQANGVENSFTVTRAAFKDAERPPYIVRMESGADFLVIQRGEASAEPLVARLNSLHVPDLINRAQFSPEAVFAWDAQHLREPAFADTQAGDGQQASALEENGPPMDLYDANGPYLRELFFHVPHLIATRLQEEERFDEARRWLGLVFDPQQKLQPGETPGVPYWNCAWLLTEDAPAAGLDHQLIDPHVIALHAPSHYRKAVFMQYVALLIGEADMQYRRQTRDSLANAWLLYRMAADLMGEVPNARAIDTWQPRTVTELLEPSQSEPLMQGMADEVIPANLPKRLATFFWAGVAAHPAFRLPVNRQLLDTWELLEARFYNLRHFLTLEGAAMQLPLYAPAANPFDLLLARMGGQANLAQLMGYRTVVPPFRFSTMLARAHEVVATLVQFGDKLRDYLEHEERTDLEARQYQQAMEIAGYTIGIQEQLLLQQRQNERALAAQRDAASVRQAHYTQLYDGNLIDQEVAAMALHGIGRTLSAVVNSAFAAANLAETVPKIFGLANGGQEYGGPLMAVGFELEIASSASLTAAELLREQAGYRRRREEWQLQAKLAGKELEIIDKQLEVQKHATLAADQAVLHSRKQIAQAEQLHDFYQNKATSVSLYRWLRGQATAWHTTLFSVAVNLCNSAEACLQFETGNYERQIIRPTLWAADHLGLDAGGNLKLELHRLEAEALLRQERHLEVRKTVSLQALLLEGMVFDKDNRPIADWPALRASLQADGELTFKLSELMYDRDYPGHYLRRLHSVALSLPALLGPYQDVRATLTQKSSYLLVKPDIEGVEYLMSPDQDARHAGRPDNVMTSLRAQQQVCLSTANQDKGLFTAAETDDRYLPFEGTGAVSKWHLRFPRHKDQASLLEGLSDIVVEVCYFALHGGELFEEQVEGLLADAAARRTSE